MSNPIDTAKYKLTKSQRRVLRQAHACTDDSQTCMLRIARQLEKKGLTYTAAYRAERYAWGKKVASLPIAVLTDEGRKVAAQLIANGPVS